MKKTLLTFIGALCCMAAMAQWSDDPAVNNQITPANYPFYESGFAVSKDGTSYIVIKKPIEGGGTYYTATFLQIVTKEGVKLFPDEGKLISHYRTLSFGMVGSLVYADNDGNALIFVSDLRNSTSNGLNYTVYKVSPTGELLWGENGIDLERGSTSNPEANIKAIQLEDGSYVFAWSRSPGGNNLNVIVDRLSRDGAFLWDAPIELISSSYPKLSNAGNNQVFLTYTKGANRALTVRKIDFDGSSVWPQEEVQVYRGGFTIPPLESVFNVTSDEKGGVFVSWYDDRNNTNRESTYVSHVKSNGQFGFYTTDGNGDIKVGYGKDIYRQFSPRTVYDKINDVLFVLWKETNSNQAYVRLVIQKLSADGELLFDLDGLQVAEANHPESIGYYSLQEGKSGGIAVFYAYSYYPYHDAVNLAALYDGEGNYLWSDLPQDDSPEEGILVSSFIPQTESIRGNKEGFTPSRLVDGKYWVTLWTDYRFASDLSDGTLFVQRVNIDGTLGPWTEETAIQRPSVISNDLTVNPSVIKGETQFVFNNSNAGNVNISVYTLSGQKAAVVFNGKLSAGTQTISWNAKAAQLSTGTYIVGITTSEGSKSVKVVII
jgi:hypothetical protein